MKNQPGAMNYSQKVDKAAEQILGFDFPMYGETVEEQEALRPTLQHTIVRAYFMREIGYETYELWQLMMQSKLHQIMPRYKELYKTTLFEIDLDNPYHMITTHNEDRDIKRSGNEDNKDIGRGKSSNNQKITDQGSEQASSESNTNTDNSDFPQASWSAGAGTYVSASSKEKGNGSTNSSNTNKRDITGDDYSSYSNAQEKKWGDKSKDIMGYIHDVKGRTNNFEVLDAIEKWRSLIVNINEMIVDELDDMFMKIY